MTRSNMSLRCLDPCDLHLPNLEWLAYNAFIPPPSLSYFSGSSQLSSLFLDFTGYMRDPPQDIASLSALSKLRTLVVEKWYVNDTVQDISPLTQVLSMRLDGLVGSFNKLIPSKPMPNFQEMTCMYSFNHFHKPAQIRNYDGVLNWPLQKLVADFHGAKSLTVRLDNITKPYTTETSVHKQVAKIAGMIHQLLANDPVLNDLSVLGAREHSFYDEKDPLYLKIITSGALEASYAKQNGMIKLVSAEVCHRIGSAR